MRTCQEVDVHVLDGERPDDALGVACPAGLGPVICSGTVGKIGLPFVLSPQIISLVHLPHA